MKSDELFIVWTIGGILSIAMIATFFSMNAKLKKMVYYLAVLAKAQGGLQGPVPDAISLNSSKTPWTCPNCKNQNAYWDKLCSKCQTPR